MVGREGGFSCSCCPGRTIGGRDSWLGVVVPDSRGSGRICGVLSGGDGKVEGAGR
ncbi:extensin precursor [Iris pallida]|uniref:Extensin n=1 Tax=Iris pallida TaxID=29817 RepID=A0AAX6H3N3_IRIPA|nr:extensin precursor [Iris pallida]KAJ6835650.1 extensin precursor [Iris pallida]